MKEELLKELQKSEFNVQTAILIRDRDTIDLSILMMKEKELCKKYLELLYKNPGEKE